MFSSFLVRMFYSCINKYRSHLAELSFVKLAVCLSAGRPRILAGKTETVRIEKEDIPHLKTIRNFLFFIRFN